MEYPIKKLSPSEDIFISQIVTLLTEAYNPKLSSYFIYRDLVYQQYFKKLLSGNSDIVFYSEMPDTGEFIGFAHFKLNNNSIWLNNIIIKEGFQGRKIGFSLLTEGLKNLSENNKSCTLFELDVFESNRKAFNLYLSLGMEISEYSYWYDITSCCTDETTDSLSIPMQNVCLKLRADANGFKQLYSDEEHVGTLINGTHLIVRKEIDYALLKKLNQAFRQFLLQSVCLVSKKELELPLIDRSFHLTVPVQKLNSKILSAQV